MTNRICYWLVTNWPFSCYNRLAWSIYLALMPRAGEHSEKLLAEELLKCLSHLVKL